MQREIVIEGYQPLLRRNPGADSYMGVNYGGGQYIIFKDDYVYSNMVKEGVVVPHKAYELLRYDFETGFTHAREVSDRLLVERVAIEFKKSWFGK